VLIACSDASMAYESLIRRRFPIVFVDRVPQALKVAAVATDNLDAGYRATRHLIELGHERIAMITGNLRLSPHADRLEGFRRAMQEYQLPIRDEYLRSGDLQTGTGYRCGHQLLALSTRPTALISSNNKMLLGLMRAIGEVGVRCPAEVSVIGFDDYVWTANFTPKLTTVAQPTYEIGRRGMEMLLKKMSDASDDGGVSEVMLLRAELRVRESTAPPEVAGARVRSVASSNGNAAQL